MDPAVRLRGRATTDPARAKARRRERASPERTKDPARGKVRTGRRVEARARKGMTTAAKEKGKAAVRGIE
jgi:hypothetical protein